MGQGSAGRPRKRSVLVTRPLPGGRELAAQLEAAGLDVHLVPVLEIAPPLDPTPLNAAAARAAEGGYDWVAVTSANGVRALSDALAKVARSGEGAPPPRARVAVVGSATAAAAERTGWKVDLVPATYTAEGLLEDFPGKLDGVRVLIPEAEAARAVLPEGLRARGAHVDVVIAYRALIPESTDPETLRRLLRDGCLDLITLASPSAAEALLELAGAAVLSVPAAVIGPVTEDAARALGFEIAAVATPHTSAGLVAAVTDWAGRS